MKKLDTILDSVDSTLREIGQSDLNDFYRFQEMAHVGKVEPGKAGKLLGIKDGAMIVIVTSEYKGTGEEPHFHLFPGNHIDKKGPANNYDLITRVKITKELPETEADIVAIKGNNPVPPEYQKFLLMWSKQSNRLGINNWLNLQNMWNSVQNEEVF